MMGSRVRVTQAAPPSPEKIAEFGPQRALRLPRRRATVRQLLGEGVMPDFPIIDSHVHLYDPAVIPYGWMKSVPKLNRPHLLADYDAAYGPVAVDGIVFAEVDADRGHHLAEAAYVESLAESDSR